MSWRVKQYGLAVRIMARSSQGFANWRTMVVSFLIAPALNVVFMVCLVSVVGSLDLVVTAYGTVLVNAVSSMVGAVTGSVARDRQLGVALDVLGRRLFNVPLWTARVVLPAAVALVAGILSAAGVLWLDPDHDTALFIGCCSLIIVAILVGACLGVLCATMVLGRNDPYILGNLVTALLPLTSGMIAPLSAYPFFLGDVCRYLPGSGVVEALRSWPTSDHGHILTACGRDAVIGLVAATLGLLVARALLSAIRAGRRSIDVF